MKKIGLVILGIMVAGFILVGCTKGTEDYDTNIQKGIESIGDEKYEKAEVYFSAALDAKKSDKQATAYLKQVQSFKKAKELGLKNEIDDAKKAYQKVTRIKDGSKVLVKRSEDAIKNLDNSKKEKEDNQKLLDQAKGLSQQAEYDKSNQKVEELLKKNLTSSDYKKMKDEAESLKKENESKIQADKEKSDADKASQEQADKEKVEPSTPQEEAMPPIHNGVSIEVQRAERTRTKEQIAAFNSDEKDAFDKLVALSGSRMTDPLNYIYIVRKDSENSILIEVRENHKAGGEAYVDTIPMFGMFTYNISDKTITKTF